MTFTPVADKAVDDLLLETDWDTYIKDNLNKGVVRPVAEATLSGAASSIDITSIAADWSHLMLVLYGRSDNAVSATALNARLNGDTGANYDHQNLQGSAAATTASEALGQTSMSIGSIPGASAGASRFGLAVLFLLHYANSASHKSVLAPNGRVAGTASGDLAVGIRLGHWRNVAAVTQITLFPGAGNFVAGTRATLYGMGGV